MNKPPRKTDGNVVDMATKKRVGGHKVVADFPSDPAIVGPVLAGSASDPRMKEALRLAGAFLAIEDAAARAALITLAEQLVSYDWIRKVQGN